jgi:hypothetical protein
MLPFGFAYLVMLLVDLSFKLYLLIHCWSYPADIFAPFGQKEAGLSLIVFASEMNWLTKSP